MLSLLSFAISGLSAASHAEKLQPQESPYPLPLVFESFSDDSWKDTWELSDIPNVTGQWEVRDTSHLEMIPGERMTFTTSDSSFYGLSKKLDEPLDLRKKPLVIQYEMRLRDMAGCGGGYIKLFGKDNFSPKALCNESKYVIMFGPDRCNKVNRIHFIFTHKNPITGVIEEKHMKKPPIVRDDVTTHMYTLIIRPDNTFEMRIDGLIERTGSLLSDFEPPVNPPKLVDDPTDLKPYDWVDDAEMDDPEASQPDDWDENGPEFIQNPAKLSPPDDWLVDEAEVIPDPTVTIPEEWDEYMHGEWEPPMIANPKCKGVSGCGEYKAPLIVNKKRGVWRAPRIQNPEFKGYWKARQIANPDYFEDLEPHNMPEIGGVGFELLIIQRHMGIANVYIGQDEKALKTWNEKNWQVKVKMNKAAKKAENDAYKRSHPVPDDQDDGSSEETFIETMKRFWVTLKWAWWDLNQEGPWPIVAICGGVTLFVGVCVGGTVCRKRKNSISKEERKRRLEIRNKKLALIAEREAQKLLAKEKARKHENGEAVKRTPKVVGNNDK